jgi:uncharacterized protein YecT (DUF1311 family)
MSATSLHLTLFSLLFALAVKPVAAPYREDACTGTTVETTNCLFQHYQQADKRLNTVYGKAVKIASRDEKDLANFRDARRKWIAYRDAAYEAEYSLFGGGSGGPAAKAACLWRITEQRIQDLKHAYHVTVQSVTPD